jgi:hypothetical protein
MEEKTKKVVQSPVTGRFIWKEVDANGSSTGLRSEGDFETESEAQLNAESDTRPTPRKPRAKRTSNETSE